MSKSIYLASKPRYEILDGLRGVAAFLVLAFHILETSSTDVMLTKYIGHGYLAVDFFFILSGFVIGHAYDDRWDKMSTGSFFKRRLIRLHPLIVFATVVGVSLFYYGMGEMFPMIDDTQFWPLMLATLFSLLMLPLPVAWDVRGWQEVNPINGNAWSLQFEYIANILYALVIRHFPRWLLALFVGLCAFLTIDVAFGIDIFGFLQGRPSGLYTMHGGWSLTTDQVYLGFVRLLYPFFAGLLLSKMMEGKGADHGQAYFWGASLLLALVLVFPQLGGETPNIWNGLFETTSILLLFPVIVWMGARGKVTGKAMKICKFFGDISYPLYIVHYPIVFTLYGNWRHSHLDASLSQVMVTALGAILFSVFLAYAALKLYDEPVRAWLKRKWFKSTDQTIKETTYSTSEPAAGHYTSEDTSFS